eukprot:10920599-Heterocapsa_arctica.AAC.1
MTCAKRMIVIGGDFNAREGNKGEDGTNYQEEMGIYGESKRNAAGRDLLLWCAANGMLVVNTLFPQGSQESGTTWIHPRWKYGAVLDYFLIPKQDRWHIATYKVRQRSTGEGWGVYTDHNPVEVHLRVGKLWTKRENSFGKTPKGPNVASMIGISEDAKKKREDWSKAVEEKMQGGGGIQGSGRKGTTDRQTMAAGERRDDTPTGLGTM